MGLRLSGYSPPLSTVEYGVYGDVIIIPKTILYLPKGDCRGLRVQQLGSGFRVLVQRRDTLVGSLVSCTSLLIADY